MKGIEYIMVTNWSLHWDKLWSKWNNSTLFTIPIIKDGLANGPWPNEARTLFIKRTKENNLFEKSWIGKSKNFHFDENNGRPAIRFEVSELEETDCPQEFKNYLNGWHRCPYQAKVVMEQDDQNNHLHLQPPFFVHMATCNWKIFEEYCFQLLRLLGIHEIMKYPQLDNRGKADGYFKFNDMSVLYDATLELEFYTQKETQIGNYVHQLKKDDIKINKTTYTHSANRQIWIITKGSAVNHITTVDDIQVKEIPYTKLIDLYYMRMDSEINSYDLCNKLKSLV